MKKSERIKIFDDAIANKSEIAVIVEFKDNENFYYEFIINHNENLKFKKEYYNNSYDEEFRLKTNENIRIIALYEGAENILIKLKDYLNAK